MPGGSASTSLAMHSARTTPTKRASDGTYDSTWVRPEVRDDLNRSLRGWSNYFCLGSPFEAFRSVDHYVRERVRAFLARRHKVAGRGNRRFTFDVIHRDRGVLCLERLPRPAPLWASQ